MGRGTRGGVWVLMRGVGCRMEKQQVYRGQRGGWREGASLITVCLIERWNEACWWFRRERYHPCRGESWQKRREKNPSINCINTQTSSAFFRVASKCHLRKGWRYIKRKCLLSPSSCPWAKSTNSIWQQKGLLTSAAKRTWAEWNVSLCPDILNMNQQLVGSPAHEVSSRHAAWGLIQR